MSSKNDIKNITQAYYEAFEIFKNKNSDNNTTFIIHDAFESVDYFNLDFNPKYHNVSDRYVNLPNINYNPQEILIDPHHYEVFHRLSISE